MSGPVTCPCGKVIEQEPGETPRQFERREKSGFCRSRCKKDYPRPRRVITMDTPTRARRVVWAGPLVKTAPRQFTGSIPKEVPWRSKKYTDFIVAHPCCVTGTPGPSDPHHEQKKGHGGKSTKAGDERQVPLRHDLHVLLETPGNSRPACWAKWKVDPEQVIARLHQEWYELTGEYPGLQRGAK